MATKQKSADPTPTQPPSQDTSMDHLTKALDESQLSTSPPSAKASRLLSLPAELRNNIYDHLLDTEQVNIGQPHVSYTHSLPSPSASSSSSSTTLVQFHASRPPFPITTALFYTNKLLSSESLSYFYASNLFIRLSLYMADPSSAHPFLESTAVLFSTAAPPLVAACTRHAMDVSITMQDSQTKRAEVLFPAQYLPRLINALTLWNSSGSNWGPEHAIALNVRNTYRFAAARVQGDLLEPWRALHSIGRVAVDTALVSPLYARGLERDMVRKGFDAQAWLDGVAETKEKGTLLFRSGDIAGAAAQFLTAIITLQTTYRMRGAELAAMPEAFSRAVNLLRWRCEINAALCGVESGTDWLGAGKEGEETAHRLVAAEDSAQNALDLCMAASPSPWERGGAEFPPLNNPDWYSDEQKAKAWFRRAVVHMALKEYLFAAGELERAQRLTPGDEAVRRAFGEARERIDFGVRPGMYLARAAKMARRVEREMRRGGFE